MNKNNLIIGRAIFTLIIIVAFGLIIMNEKGNQIFSKKIEEKLNNYISSNYNSISSSVNTDISLDNNKTIMKVTSKENNNHYFYITYSERKIIDTYTKDYQQGKNLLDYITNNMEKEIKDKTNINVQITPITTLDKYSDKVQQRIIKEENLLDLKFYYLETELNINNWNKEEITESISNLINKMIDNSITPKYYKLTINNTKDDTFSIEISKIQENFVSNKDSIDIINDIITNTKSELLKENNITYKYLNEEE